MVLERSVRYVSRAIEGTQLPVSNERKVQGRLGSKAMRTAALYSVAVLLQGVILCPLLLQFSLVADEMQYKAYRVRHWAALLAVFLCCVWLLKSILVVLLCRQ